jgi:hypothetical protein
LVSAAATIGPRPLDHAASARTVVHDDGGAEGGGELLRDRASGEIDAAAGRVRHDDAQRLHGIRLCSGQRCIEQQRGRAKTKNAEFFMHVQRLRSR